MAVTVPNDFSSFRVLLSNLLDHDNETRTKAEAVYDEIQPGEKIFMLLTAIVNEGVPVEEAELAAVLLRRLISNEFETIFSKLSPELNAQIKNQILHRVQQDINRNLRKKISDVSAEIARNCIDEEGNNLWPEFLKFLFDSISSPDPTLKEMSLLMFASVPGVFGNQQSKYMDVICNMLSVSLADNSKDVRYAAVKATASFLLAHEKEVNVQKQLNTTLVLLLSFFGEVLADEEGRPEEVLRHLVDLVDTCPQAFRGHLDNLFQLCLKGTLDTYPESCRHLALETMVTLSETAPAMVRKLGIKHLPVLIVFILKMMTNLDDDPNWNYSDVEINDDDNDSSPVVAESALDRLACALGGKTVLPLVLSSLTQMLNSGNWNERHAGLMTISAVGEGCHKQMTVLLPQIVDGVIPFLLDSHPRVRYAACNALGQMSTDFAPTFQKKFHEKVIPGLLELLEDSNPRVQAHAGAALVNFFEDCPKNVVTPYMGSIVEKLKEVLNTKLKELVEKGTKLVLEQVVVTIASLADSAEEKFIYYYDKFMPCLKYIIQNASQPDLRVLRGKTIECVSLIGLAVGKEKFLGDASEVMDLLLKTQTADCAISDDDPQLSYMIAAWARICKILGKAFEPYLPYVMEPVLKAAALKPEIAVLDCDEDGAPKVSFMISSGPRSGASYADDMKVVENDDEWEFVNLGEKHNFGIRTAGMDEKAQACQMLVCYARELKEGFAAYVEETVKLMVPMLKFYFHDVVRVAAAEILPHLLESAKVRGEAYVQEMWKFILTHFLQALDTEPESEVLAEMMADFAQCIEVLNYRCLSHEDLLFLMNILSKNLLGHFERSDDRFQKRKEEDYDDCIEESLLKEDDDDVYLLSKIADVICSLFATYKQDFMVYFDMVLEHFIRLAEPSRPWQDRQWSLCVFADVIEYGGPACSRYQQYFLQPILTSLQDEVADVRQTAAYALGVLGQFGGPEFAKICAESVPILIQMISDPNSRSEDNVRATENAISAVTKFLVCNNSLINMDKIIPLWLTWLPIWEDEEEAKYVYNFLCSLLETNNQLLLGNENCNLPRIVEVVAEAFYKEGIEPTSDVGKRVLALMREIQRTAEIFNICISLLRPELREALHTALTVQ